MGFSFNPLLWFLCGTCKEAFPNTEELKEHKLSQHLGDCLRIKFIVFEEKFVDDAWIPSNHHCSAPSSANEQLLHKNFENKTQFNKFQNPYVSLKRLTQPVKNSRIRGRKTKNSQRSLNLVDESPPSNSTCNKPCENNNIETYQNATFKIPKPVPIPIFLPKDEPEEHENGNTELPLEGSASVLFSSSLSPNSTSNGILHSDYSSKELGDGELIMASVTSTSNGIEVEFAPFPFALSVPFQADQSNAIEDCIPSEIMEEGNDLNFDDDYEFEPGLMDDVEPLEEMEDFNSFTNSPAPSISFGPEPEATFELEEPQPETEPELEKDSQTEAVSGSKLEKEINQNSVSRTKSKKKLSTKTNTPEIAAKNNLKSLRARYRKACLKSLGKTKKSKKNSSRLNLTCSICSAAFPLKWELRQHMLIHPKNVTYKCNQSQCIFACGTRQGLRKHSLKHKTQRSPGEENESVGENDEAYQPPIDLNLDLSLLQWLVLQEEKNSSNLILLDPDPKSSNEFQPVSQAHPVKCKWCEERFASEFDLRWHVSKCFLFNKMMHRYCHKCDKTFSKPTVLRVHNVQFNHSSEESTHFECSVCSKKFHKESVFKFHEAIHSQTEESSKSPTTVDEHGIKTDQIPLSQWLLLQRDSNPLNRILLEPDPLIVSDFDVLPISDTNTVQCLLCEQVLTSDSLVRSHVSMCFLSNKKKHHYCLICNKRVQNLREHNRVVHHLCIKESGSYHCTVCSEKFTRKKHLVIHQANEHENLVSRSYQCKICSESFSTRSSLTNHKHSVHPKLNFYKCSYNQCSASFPTNHELIIHLKEHKIESPSVVDLNIDLPLSQWLIVQEEKNPSNLILMDPDPKSTNEFQPVSEVHPVKCKLCVESFASEFDLRSHVSKCFLFNKMMHRYCHKCDKTFSSPNAMRVHSVEVNHSTKHSTYFKCSKCSKQFHKESVFKLHESTHSQTDESSKSPTVIDELGVETGEISLSQWLLLQRDSNPLNRILLEPDPLIVSDFDVLPISDTNTVQCLLCELVLTSDSLVRSHVSMCFFSNKKNHHYCLICNKRFQNLHGHNRVVHHLCIKEKGSYNCTECSEKFTLKKYLLIHRAREHQNLLSRSYQCKICSESFSSGNSLINHRNSVHSEVHFYKCSHDQCSASFPTNQALIFHLRKHVVESPSDVDLNLDLPLSEWLVLQEEKNPSNLILLDPDPKSSHEFQPASEVHPVKCKLCGERFASEFDLRWHVSKCFLFNKMMHRYCHMCDKTFSTPHVMRVHNVEVDHSAKQSTYFKCSKCSKKFHKESVLKFHEVSHSQTTESSTSPTTIDQHSVEIETDPIPLSQWLLLQRDSNPLNRILLEPDPLIVSDFDILPVSDTNTVECKLCEETLTSDSLVRSHVSTCFLSNKKNHHYCLICNKRFQRLRKHNLLVHRLCIREKGSFKCTLCSEKFTLKKLLLKHQASEHQNPQNRSYPCRICSKSFATQILLTNHKNSVHPIMDFYKCSHDQCSASFPTNQELISHLKEHNSNSPSDVDLNLDLPLSQWLLLQEETNPANIILLDPSPHPSSSEKFPPVSKKNPVKCKWCAKFFHSEPDLRSHVSCCFLLKKNSHRYCQECDRIFCYPGALRGHIRIMHASNPRPIYKCLVCAKEFLHENTLKFHQLSHEAPKGFESDDDDDDEVGEPKNQNQGQGQEEGQEKNENKSIKCFQCKYCAKSFMLKAYLNRHEITHTGERPFKCDVANCGKSYNLSGTLLKHRNSKHFEQLGLPGILCPVCGKKFGLKSLMQTHIFNEHSESRPCKCTYDSCSRSFNNNGLLAAHIRTHHTGERPFQCDQCGKSFSMKNSLKKHIKFTHEGFRSKKVTCSLCPRQFKDKYHLKQHMKTHEGATKSFKCKICGFLCAGLAYFRRHENLHAKNGETKNKNTESDTDSDVDSDL